MTLRAVPLKRPWPAHPVKIVWVEKNNFSCLAKVTEAGCNIGRKGSVEKLRVVRQGSSVDLTVSDNYARFECVRGGIK